MIKEAPKQQKGAALLVFFLILFTVSSTVLLAGFNSNSARLKSNSFTQEEMLSAKEALLAYSFSFSDNFNLGPGRLPCRDQTNIDGEPDCSTPGVQNGLGRLPIRDSAIPFVFSSKLDNQLWYVAAEGYRSDTLLLNSNTVSSLLSIDGDASYVAVIIDSGEELPGQDRLNNNILASNYLEGGNDAGTVFVNSSLDEFNDHVIGITKTELMSLAVIKAAQEFKGALNEYYNKTYSYPRDGYIWDTSTWVLAQEHEVDSLNEAYNNSSLWFTANTWDQQVSYTFNNSTSATFSFAECAIIFTLEYGSNLSLNQRACE